MQNQTLFSLITSRRSCFKFLDKDSYPVSHAAITQCLESAITAPNHRMTQPWRFWDLGAEKQALFAKIYAKNRAAKKHKTESNAFNDAYDKAIIKFNSLPKVILVGQSLSDNERIQKEDYAACACAIQNFQLVAWQQNIGLKWSTGPIITDQSSYQLLDINSKEIELIGALYIGNIDENCLPSPITRKSLNDVLIKTS